MSGSTEVRFALSAGLRQPLVVPQGTLAQAQEHVQDVERALGLAVMRRPHSPARWRTTTPKVDIDDIAWCRWARAHNAWVERFWKHLEQWTQTPPTGSTETLTPEQAATFWHGLADLDVPPEHWDREHGVDQLTALYEILRGRPQRGFRWGTRPLTPEQAGGVLWLVGEYLGVNPGDIDMEAPRAWETKDGRTRLVQIDEARPNSSYNGNGYVWCERCGAVATDNSGETGCPRRESRCPVKQDRAG